jgi:antitoxin HicB
LKKLPEKAAIQTGFILYTLEKLQLQVKTEPTQNHIKRKKSTTRSKSFGIGKKEEKMKAHKLRYQMLIQWSEGDDCFLVGFPDFPGQQWRTHGDTYELAVANGIEALESLVMAYEATGEPLPEPASLDVA